MNTDRMNTDRCKWLNGRSCPFWAVVLALTLLAGRVCQADNFKLSTAEQDWLKGHPVIRMGIDAGFGPYTFLDAEGHLQGIAAEFIAEIERHLGIRFEIVSNLSWTQLMEEVRERRLDALAGEIRFFRKKFGIDDRHFVISCLGFINVKQAS